MNLHGAVLLGQFDSELAVVGRVTAVDSEVISGHLGWVRSVAVDPSNISWLFCSSCSFGQLWDLASGVLKLTLIVHIEQVRGLAVSNKHTYMFSAGDHKQNPQVVTGSHDTTIKMWDLRYGKTMPTLTNHKKSIYNLLVEHFN
ncbi:hypothetical protein GYH30_016115 [Glycine max]|uniref:Uncharacterized protein n=1 Tax=Glycine max TaxID=3847 RepID=K7KX22_SOYBN|nr:hypothetical protein GYH30_016115 [Glycine max]